MGVAQAAAVHDPVAAEEDLVGLQGMALLVLEEDQEVEAAQQICRASLSVGAGFRIVILAILSVGGVIAGQGGGAASRPDCDR